MVCEAYGASAAALVGARSRLIGGTELDCASNTVLAKIEKTQTTQASLMARSFQRAIVPVPALIRKCKTTSRN